MIFGAWTVYEACLEQTQPSSLQKNADCEGREADQFRTSCSVSRRKVNCKAMLDEPLFLLSIIKVEVNSLTI